MVERCYPQGKTPDTATRSLWKFYQQRHLEASKRNGRKEREFRLAKYFYLHLQVIFFTCRQSYDMGPRTSLPLPKEGVPRIFITLKNLSPRPGLKPRALGPMASTLTITPPRWPVLLLFWLDSVLFLNSDFASQSISVDIWLLASGSIFRRVSTWRRIDLLRMSESIHSLENFRES
jgi:hypothetical protein